MSALIQLADFAPAVSHDFSTVMPELGGANSVRVVILDDEIPSTVAQAVPDAAEWRDPAAGAGAQLLLVTSTGVTSLDATMDDTAGIDVELASRLQDLVMDAQNTPWPVVRLTSGATAIAEPAVVLGRACWTSRGEVVVDVGQLSRALER